MHEVQLVVEDEIDWWGTWGYICVCYGARTGLEPEGSVECGGRRRRAGLVVTRVWRVRGLWGARRRRCWRRG
jgi:hypothetical protein